MSFTVKQIRNVCLLGHSGSGKTTLVESMLYQTDAIARMGKTPDGNTTSDFDAEEIRRQISISASIVPIKYKDCLINVIDCPGNFDFCGEVAEALTAADAAVIVLPAKGGVPVGAERAWKLARARKLPTMFYISKVDEDNSDYNAVVSSPPCGMPIKRSSAYWMCWTAAPTVCRPTARAITLTFPPTRQILWRSPMPR